MSIMKKYMNKNGSLNEISVNLKNITQVYFLNELGHLWVKYTLTHKHVLKNMIKKM